MSSLGLAWLRQLFAVLAEDRGAARELQAASVEEDLSAWTTVMTRLVVTSFESLGFSATAKGHRSSMLPIRRGEYLGQDVMAFRTGGHVWRFPAVVCELENSPKDDMVAYSLWKVLCVRAELRVVFCYRPDAGCGPSLVARLASQVVQAMPVEERARLDGDTLIVLGSRNESRTFPYGFFGTWKLSTNTGRFEHFARR